MMPVNQSKPISLSIMLSLLLLSTPVHAADPWTNLQSAIAGSSRRPVAQANNLQATAAPAQQPQDDPWSILQAYYLPFTEEDETAAASNPTAQRKVAGLLHAKLVPYQSIINEASQRFDIPAAVIGAVIMVESSGNVNVAAQTSSAKGLMQTIDATFAEARNSLHSQGLSIPNDPFQPEASIMAGSWYLDRMFRQMERDRGSQFDRNDFAVWRKVAEYYYAGPNHGRKREGVVIMYAGGKRLVVDKAGYAQKVMKWARMMG